MYNDMCNKGAPHYFIDVPHYLKYLLLLWLLYSQTYKVISFFLFILTYEILTGKEANDSKKEFSCLYQCRDSSYLEGTC